MKTTNKAENKKRFEDLKVGEGYIDENGLLCIKTSNYNEFENCICYADGSWGACYQSDYDWVTPIEVTYLTNK